jgi:hypothetical protein
MTPEIIEILKQRGDMTWDSFASIKEDEMANVGKMGLRKARQVIAYAKRHMA